MVPLGKLLVMASFAGAMVMDSLALADCVGEPESVTLTVTVELPETVGVPLTVQPFTVSPAGNDPVIVQLYGVTPPLAPIVALYGTPTVPPGSVPVRLNTAGAIVIVSFVLTLCAGLAASVTVMEIGELPAVVGVPLTVQPLNARPAGSAPAIEHA